MSNRSAIRRRKVKIAFQGRLHRPAMIARASSAKMSRKLILCASAQLSCHKFLRYARYLRPAKNTECILTVIHPMSPAASASQTADIAYHICQPDLHAEISSLRGRIAVSRLPLFIPASAALELLYEASVA